MNRQVVEALKAGQVVVMPTDTIFGVVAKADNQQAVENLYRIKQSPDQKKSIILISELADLLPFGIKLTPSQEKILDQVWPGPASAILDLPENKSILAKWDYLHCGTKTLAFRLPALLSLRKLIAETGPLVAPSANPSGQEPAKNITEAKKYFGDLVSVYVTGEIADPRPSTLIRVTKDGGVEIRRQGVAEIKLNKVQ